MSKLLKWGGGILLVLAALIAITFFVLFQSVNGIIEATVEKVGSEVTGTNVELGGVDISLTEGKGSLNQFKLENPEGFSPNDAFKFEKVSVTLDLETIFSDPVIVKEVLIVSPDITYEIGDQGNNFDALIASTKENAAAKKTSSQESEAEAADSSEKETPNIIIKRVILDDGSVAVRIPTLSDERVEVKLPKVILKDIGGKDKKGATPDVIAEEMMTQLSEHVAKFATQLDPIKLFKDLDIQALSQMKGFENITGDLQKELNSLGDSTKDIEKNIDKKIEDGVGSLKNLLGN